MKSKFVKCNKKKIYKIVNTRFECENRLEFAVEQEKLKYEAIIQQQRAELLTIFQEERSQLIDAHNEEIECLKKNLKIKFDADFLCVKAELETMLEKKYIELDVKWQIDEQSLKAILEETKRDHENLILYYFYFFIFFIIV